MTHEKIVSSIRQLLFDNGVEINTCDDKILEIDFETIGVSSLVFLELLTSLEKKFNVQIDDDLWSYDKLNNIKVLVNYLETL